MGTKISALPAAAMATIASIPVVDSGATKKATPKQLLDNALNDLNGSGRSDEGLKLNGGPSPGSFYLSLLYRNNGTPVASFDFDWANVKWEFWPSVAARPAAEIGSNGSTSYVRARAPVPGSDGDPGTGFSYVACAESANVDAIWMRCDELNTLQEIGSDYYGSVFQFCFDSTDAVIDSVGVCNWNLNWNSAHASNPTSFEQLLHSKKKCAVVSWSTATLSVTAATSDYYRFTGTIASAFTLPAADFSADYFGGNYGGVITISNRGTSAVTVTARGSNTIEGLATLVLAAGQTKTFRCVSTAAWDAY